MRVNTLTLATASAAALTFGLASPALASPMFGDYQGLRTQGAHSQLLPGEAAQALLQRGGDDDDDDCGDGDGCGDGDSSSRHRHCGSSHSCRGFFHHRGPLSGFGGGFGGGEGGGGGGDGVEWGESGHIAGARHARHMRARAAAPAPRMARPGRVVVHRRQVERVPSRAVPTGFGGSQGMNLPLGIAGLSLILGGAGLLPLARRRIRTSERS
jgi:hypothetical protein